MNTNFPDKNFTQKAEAIMKHKYFKPALIVIVLLIAGISFQAIMSDSVSGKEEESAAASSSEAESWKIRCAEGVDVNKPEKGKCEVVQTLYVKETGQRFAEMAVGYSSDDGKPRGVVILPLGILLESGVLFQIDDMPPFKFSPRYCDNNGCVAYLDISDKIMNGLRKGENVKLGMKITDGRQVSVDIPLKGFSKALKQVD